MIGHCAVVYVHKEWVHPSKTRVTVNYSHCPPIDPETEESRRTFTGKGLYVRFGSDPSDVAIIRQTADGRVNMVLDRKGKELRKWILKNPTEW